MRKFSLGLAVFLAAIALGADLTAVRKAMDKKAQEFATAVKSKDIGWFKKQATPDFVSIEKNGNKLTLKETLATMQQMFSMMKITECTSKVKSLKMDGKNALVVTVSSMKGTMPGRDGKTAKLVDSSEDEETWVPSGKDWKIKQTKSLSEKATLDGKPFNGG